MTTTATRAGAARRRPGRTADGDVVGQLLGFAMFVALGLFVPMLILATPDHHRSNAWILTLGLTVVSAIRLSVLIARGERRLLEFIFWLFTYVFFGMSPTVQIRLSNMPGTTPELDPALDLPTALLATVGVVGTAIGFGWSGRRPRRAPGRRARPALTERWSFDISQTRLVLLSLVGLAGSGYYVAKVGVGTLFGSRAGSVLVEDQLWPDPSVAGIVRACSSFPVLIAAHAWWILARSTDRKAMARVAGAALTLVSLAVTNPVSSSRYGSGVVWGSFLGPGGAYRTSRRTSVTLASLIGALLFLFPIADLFRRVNSVNVRRSGFLAEYAGNGDYDAFGQLSNAILYDLTMPLQVGRQLLGQLFFWLPRSIWVDKPINTGSLLAEFRGYTFTNLSAPIWAEMLLNFGLVSVPVLSLLMGYWLGKLDLAFRKVPDRGTLAIATAVLPFYLLIVLRGSLLQATGTLAVIIVSMIFVTRPRPIERAGRRSAQEAQDVDRASVEDDRQAVPAPGAAALLPARASRATTSYIAPSGADPGVSVRHLKNA